MRITQGCFSFLPDLTDEQIAMQIEYCLGQGWAIGVRIRENPLTRRRVLAALAARDSARYVEANR